MPAAANTTGHDAKTGLTRPDRTRRRRRQRRARARVCPGLADVISHIFDAGVRVAIFDVNERAGDSDAVHEKPTRIGLGLVIGRCHACAYASALRGAIAH